MYFHPGSAEKLVIPKATAPPSTRTGFFPGVSDSVMELLNGK